MPHPLTCCSLSSSQLWDSLVFNFGKEMTTVWSEGCESNEMASPSPSLSRLTLHSCNLFLALCLCFYTCLPLVSMIINGMHVHAPHQTGKGAKRGAPAGAAAAGRAGGKHGPTITDFNNLKYTCRVGVVVRRTTNHTSILSRPPPPQWQDLEMPKIHDTVHFAFDIRRSVPGLWMRSRVHQTPYVRKIFSRVHWLLNCEKAISIICFFAYHDYSSRKLSAYRNARLEHARCHMDPLDAIERIALPSFKLPTIMLLAVESDLLQESMQWTCSSCTFINMNGLHLVCAMCLSPRGDVVVEDQRERTFHLRF